MFYIHAVPDGPPQGINLTGVDPAMLSVRYSRPLVEHVNGDLTGYMIRYSRVGSGEVEVMSVVNGDNLSSLISGLVAYVSYSIEVAANNINGTGPFSDPVFGLSGQDGEHLIMNPTPVCYQQNLCIHAPFFKCGHY